MTDKVIYHGSTVIDDTGRQNPPPYPGPAQDAYPHPQPTYPAPGPAPVYTATTFVTQPTMVRPGVMVGTSTMVITNQMSPKPMAYQCKSCSAQIVTRVDQKPTTRTHLFALVLCLLGCWPCVCIPYCTNECLSTDHYCPNCNSYLGSYIS